MKVADAPDPKANGKAFTQDGLQNVITRLNVDGYDPKVQNAWTTSAELAAVTRDEIYLDFIAKAACDKPAASAVRRWFELKVEGADEDEKLGEQSKLVMDALEDLRLRETMRECLRLDAKDGGCLLVLGVDDGESDLARPIGKVRKLGALHVVERPAVTVSSWVADRSSPRFGKPEVWNLSSGLSASRQAGSQPVLIHASRTLAFTGDAVPWLRSGTVDNWGGFSKLQWIKEPLERYRTLWGHVEQTFKHFTTTVVKLMGLAQLMVENTPDSNDQVVRRIQLMQMCRSALNAIPIDSEDDIDELAVALTGAAEMLLRAQDDIAGAAGIPLTMLFGHSPAGFSQDDTPGMRNFYDLVADLQQTKLVQPINLVIETLCASREGPTKGTPLKRFQQRWLPLAEPTEKEVADVRATNAKTAQTYVEMQALEPSEVRSSLRSDPRCPYEIADDEELPEAKPEDLDPGIDPDTVPGGGSVKPGAGNISGDKVADRLPPGITIENVKDIAIAVTTGEVPKPFGVWLSSIALGLPESEVAAGFASVEANPEKIAARAAESKAKATPFPNPDA